VLLPGCGNGVGWREDVEMLLTSESFLPATTTVCTDSANGYICVKERMMWQCSLKVILSDTCSLVLTRSWQW
jgi:hypothetical protein